MVPSSSTSVLGALLLAVVLVAFSLAQSVPSCDSDTKVYDFDRLSDRDFTIFDSRSPEYWRADDQNTSLRQVLMIHRHGDRTPIDLAPNDPLRDDDFWNFHGRGQLTNRGKARLHMLGEIMRMRYDVFLAGSVNKNSRKSRSSGALRCIESAQTFLSSFLGLNQTRSPDANELRWDRSGDILAQIWQPASINTLAAKIDGMLNEGASCKKLDDEEYKKIDESKESKQINKEFETEKNLLKEVINFDIDHFYKWFWAASFLEVELSYYPSRVDSRLKEAYGRINKASDRTLALYQSTLSSRRLRAGLLVKNMIDNMKDMRKSIKDGAALGPITKKFVHYSAHDMNLVVLLGIFGNFENFPMRPDYASNLIIELHQDSDDTNEWFIKLFYMQHVPNKHIQIYIPGCDRMDLKGRCLLDRFDEMMRDYKIENWQTWMRECGNDINLADPYSENT